MQKEDPTIAALLKAQGYATGQFGKNHLGDKDEFLPSNHGFDEFFGNLYHLNAEEEPENEDYPGDMKLKNGKTFREQFGPRSVIHSWALPDGTQKIVDTGPLTKKRMETIDDETVAAAVQHERRAGDCGQVVGEVERPQEATESEIRRDYTSLVRTHVKRADAIMANSHTTATDSRVRSSTRTTSTPATESGRGS